MVNYNICIERDKLLHQRMSELVEDMDYYKAEIKKLQPEYQFEFLPEQLEEFEPDHAYKRTWIEDLNFEF